VTVVAVVGGGVIGLAVAWRCAQRGLDVTVYDRPSGEGASAVAAGMIAPTSETRAGEDALCDLLTRSARRWPDFAAELEQRAGIQIGYRDEGTLIVALTDDDMREVRRLCAGYQRAGQPVLSLTADELRAREPLLSPRIRGGAYAPHDRQVDPRRLLHALSRVVRIRPERVTDLAAIDADVTIVAAGIGTRALTGLPIRPVKGQTVRVRAAVPPVRHVIRGYARGRAVYLVPRQDGEVVIGATEEERGTDTGVTAGGLLDLLRPAAELLPGIAEYPVSEIVAGLRPGTPDNAPILGVLPPGAVLPGAELAGAVLPGAVRARRGAVIVAAGHYRHGVLLAPITADAIAELAATGVTPAEIKPFTPTREALCT
jgi:glycine oxidase